MRSDADRAPQLKASVRLLRLKIVRTIFTALACLCLMTVTAAHVKAEGWRGIVPLHSTREDVVRLLGQCSDEVERCVFSLPTEDVYIAFSAREACSHELPAGTVLLIERELLTATSLLALNLDKRRFKIFDPSWPRNIGYRGYIDEKAGLILKAFNGGIFQIDYIATAEDRRLCPAYYREPRQFVQVVREHVPVVSVSCPPDTLTAGEPIRFIVQHTLSGLRMTFGWHLSAGKIIDGQGRRQITVDTTGLEGQTIVATVERWDSFGHVVVASCKVQFKANSKLIIESLAAEAAPNKRLQRTGISVPLIDACL
jgi:hypothetical protein